jgi:hypothetical protein
VAALTGVRNLLFGINDKTVTVRVQAATAGLNAIRGLYGFSRGGYTGPGGKNEVAGIVHRDEFVFPREAVRRIGVDNLYRFAGLRGASAGDLSGLGNMQASAGLTARRPAGGGGSTGVAVAAAPAAATPGPLLNIEEYYEQPGSSPAANAQALAVEVRTRPWS